ncbi:Ribosome biogenesis protein bms1 [Leucoagaricus sp. SymC.cos]|nr:Ribosome biogenesis protein bms1 [Leucoagaricus sp. SymC.cos]
MKFRPLVSRNSHPYILVDHLEDLTPRELMRTFKGKCNHTVMVYGYVRGRTNLRPGAKVRILGVGDLDVTSIQHLGDPCPLLDKELEKRRKLSEKKKLFIHAPTSNVSGVIYDKDAVWINVPGSFSRGNNEVSQGEGKQMVMDLQDISNTLKDAISKSQIQLFRTSSNTLTIMPDEDAEMEDEDKDVDEYDEDEEGNLTQPSTKDHLLPGDDDDVDILSGDDHAMDDGEESEGEEDEGDEMKSQTHGEDSVISFILEKGKGKNWIKLIYSSGNKDANEEEEVDDLFTIKHKSEVNEAEVLDISKELFEEGKLGIWEDEELLESIQGLFITGDDSTAVGENNKDKCNGIDGEDDHEDVSGSNDGEGVEAPEDQAATDAKTLQAKKEALKCEFDEQYDNPESSKADSYDTAKDVIASQPALNKAGFEGVDSLVEGFRPGMYIRIELQDVPCEMVEHFDHHHPMVVGGLLAAEERFGHQWFTRPLKMNDPLILSLSWQRFQTVPIYSLDDHSIQMRMLKYTPEHMYYYATIRGPISLPNTCFYTFNPLWAGTPGFRISAMGVVLDIDWSVKIVKKLKVTGVPYVVNFEGANTKTVLGIRGQVKEALPKPDSIFRALFEDKVLKSSLIFL